MGGCCRDMIMQRPVNDIDLAVDLVDGGVQFARWLSRKGLTTGRPVIFARYGTAMVKLRRFGGAQVEIVQTRKAKYTPDIADTPEVAFGTIEEDARRRDLTINSLYLDLSTFRMIDYCRAVDDLRARRLRTPMDADETFADDPVRALRIIRFATVLGWEIDPDILPAISRAAPQLTSIKVERIANEFEKMMASDHPDMGLQLLHDLGMMPYVLPGFDSLPQTMRNHIRVAVKQKGLDDMAARLAVICILMSLAKPKGPSALETGQYLLQRLRLTSDIRHKVDFYTRFWQATERWGDVLENLKPRLLRGFMRMCGDERKLNLMLNLIEQVRKRSRLKALAPQVQLIRDKIKAENLVDIVYNNALENNEEPNSVKPKKSNASKRRREKRRRERRRLEKRMNRKNNQ